mmetsp:Transcript_1545/g.3304  ORF Transcript_1545/g.3304 Transcript_1545/m.3304 type:complete len:591 (+) Transcript_1545:547-2319(+)
MAKGYPEDFVNQCGAELLNEIWFYSVINNTLTYIKPTYNRLLYSSFKTPSPRQGHAAAYIEVTSEDIITRQLTTRKYMYIYGGFSLDCSQACSDLWRYEIPWAAQRYYPEPSAGYWNRGGHWEVIELNYWPGPRMFHSLTASPDYQHIYMFGGTANGKYYNELWKYNVKASSWENIQTLGINTVMRTITLWTGEDIEMQVEFSKRVESDSVVYTSGGKKPDPRCSHSIVYFSGVSENYIILFGGQGQRTITSTYTVTFDDLWVYSLKLQRWTQAFPNGDKPVARKDAQMQQYDSRRIVMQGGTNGNEFFNDIWLYNVETNTWKEWVYTKKPDKRAKHALVKINDGLVVFGGYQSTSLDQEAIDKAFSLERTYLAECQTLLKVYNVSLSDIGQDYYEKTQQAYYNLTGSSCFLRTEPLPILERGYSFPTDIWVLNFTQCPFNCTERGNCLSSRCVCDSGYYGEYCQNKACPGSLCFHDFDFFESEKCYHCSGNGACNNGTCICNEGFYGSDCSTLACANSCSEAGECIQMFPISQCNCRDIYGGDDCSVAFCLNNCNTPQGTCNTTTGLCTCESEFIGEDCSVVLLTAESK